MFAPRKSSWSTLPMQRLPFPFRQILSLWLIAVTLNTGCSKSTNGSALKHQSDLPLENSSRVIYGPDSRLDLYQIIDQRTRRQAQSVAALVAKKDVNALNSTFVELQSSPLGEAYGLCSTESFLDQKNPAFCTGFLVAPQILVTAGHCILNETECAKTSFVFGFAIEDLSQPYWIRPQVDVYSCGRLIQTESGEGETDFAIIELDRPVGPQRTPLPLRTRGKIEAQDMVSMLGHSLGLPLKQTTGRVTETSKYYFSTSLDSFGGNSGAPVFNTFDGRVEGIFRGGDQDFEEKEGCLVSKKCSEKTCQGEVVTAISEVLPYLR
jgi:hypothetical protein